ncbi:hypothetical protein JCM11641_006266 [Rhodosporidiobolus odoratus]
MSNRKFLTDVPWTREQLRRLMSGKRVALEYKPFKTLVTDITRLVLRLPTTRAVERLESILQALGQMEETHYDVLVVPCAADCEAILSGARKGAPRTYQQVIKQALDRVRQELATGKVDEKTLTNDSLLLESCIVRHRFSRSRCLHPSPFSVFQPS